jgi:leucyl-tRNA synthetase
MDTFVDSSWYFLRYTSPEYTEGPFDRAAADRWMPTYQYVGGKEHAVLHLLYSRFFVKVLFDMGLVSFTEPFITLLNQGMVVFGGAALSKSKGNVVELGPLIEQWGADSIRTAMMFAGPIEDDVDWATVSLPGIHRWLGRVWRAVSEASSRFDASGGEGGEALRRFTHRTIKGVTQDFERFGYNVAISKLMTLTNEVQASVDRGGGGLALREAAEALVLMAAPVTPHLSEELWHSALGHDDLVSLHTWPSWDEDLAREDEVVLVVQVDGKVRDRVTVAADADEAAVRAAAEASDRARRSLEGRRVERVVVRPPRLVNFVTTQS